MMLYNPLLRIIGVAFTLGIISGGLVCGCRSQKSRGYSIVEEINAGRMTPSNPAAPGDADPLASLVALIAFKPDSTRYIVRWENFYPPNTIYQNRMEYDADEETLWSKVDNKSRDYSRVTIEMLKSARAANKSTDSLTDYGARSEE